MGSEPALILGAVNALVALGVGFGLNWTASQVGLVNAAVSAILAVILRQSVVAPDTHQQAINDAKKATP